MFLAQIPNAIVQKELAEKIRTTEPVEVEQRDMCRRILIAAGIFKLYHLDHDGIEAQGFVDGYYFALRAAAQVERKTN